MKKIVLLAALFTAWNSLGQDQIFKKDGTTITPVEGTTELVLSERRFTYSLPNVKKVQKISYKDIDYVLFGNYKFKPVRLKKGKFHGYFQIGESEKYNLYTMAISSPYHYYEVIVTDKQNKIVEYNDFMANNMGRHNNDRRAAGETIEKYFEDCRDLIDRVQYLKQQNTDKKEVKMGSWVSDLLRQPDYFDCTN